MPIKGFVDPDLFQEALKKNQFNLHDLNHVKVNDWKVFALCRDIFFSDSYGKRRILWKFIHKSTAQEDSVESQTVQKCTKGCKTRNGGVLLALNTLQISKNNWPNFLRETYCPQNSIYGKICQILGFKNNIKNRKRIKKEWIDISLKSNDDLQIAKNSPSMDQKHYRDEIDHSPQKTDCEISRFSDKNENSSPSFSPITRNDNQSPSPIESPIVPHKKRKLYVLSSDSDLEVPKESQPEVSHKFNFECSTPIPFPLHNLEKQRQLESSDSEDDIRPAIFSVNKYERNQVEKLLPLGTKNIWCQDDGLRDRRLVFSNCDVIEGEFLITHQEWDDIFINGKLVADCYNYFLTKKLQTVNNVCVICIKSSRRNKNNVTIYAYCKHESCKTFKIIVTRCEDFYQAIVFSNSLNYRHGTVKLNRPIRGVHRRLVEQDLEKSKPSVVRGNAINRASDMIVSEGNLDEIHSMEVYRKIRSQFFGKKDRHADDLFDVLLMKRSSDLRTPFIFAAGEPFYVHVMSREQFYAAKKMFRAKKWLDLHLDATGKTVRRPCSTENKIYYYAAVISLQNNKVMPVTEMVSCKHDANSISHWLSNFKFFCKDLGQWPICKRVVTDFSLAIINAVLNTFNLMTLPQYLNTTYPIVRRNECLVGRHFVVLKLCTAHLMKNLSKDINSCISDKAFKTFLKENMASLFNSTTLTITSAWFYNITLILLFPSTCELIDEALVECKNIALRQECSQKTLEMIASIEFDSMEENNTHVKDSLFYRHFQKIVSFAKHRIQTCVVDTEEGSKYFCPKLLYELLDKYFKYYPLWCGSKTSPADTIAPERCSNAVAENWFGTVKNNILNNKTNLKCSRFLRTTRSYVTALSKELKLKIGKEDIKKKKKIETEKWAKKKKRKHSYFKQITLRKMDAPQTKPLETYSNGLVRDGKYYVAISCRLAEQGKDLQLCSYSDRNVPIKDIFFADILCLSNNIQPTQMWLNSFIIDLVLNIYSDNSNANVMLCEIASNILVHKIFNYPADNFPEIKNILIMPVNTGNHWCLAVADFNRKTFMFYDPIGNDAYTVLVPTDRAFQRWHPIDWGFYPFSVPEFTEGVLSNHFIKGNIKQETLPNKYKVKTLGGEEIEFVKGADGKVSANGIEVVKGDTPVTRGNIMFVTEVLFVDDAVVGRLHEEHRDKETPPLLAFPWFGSQFLSHAFLSIESTKGFSHVTRFLNVADLVPHIPGAGYTFFVPTDDAFKKLGLDTAPDNLLSNKEGLNVLLSHFVKGRLYDRDIKDNATLKSLSNRTLHITRKKGTNGTIEGANIIEKEVFVYNLGTMFYIDNVIFGDEIPRPPKPEVVTSTKAPETTTIEITHSTRETELNAESGTYPDILLADSTTVFTTTFGPNEPTTIIQP